VRQSTPEAALRSRFAQADWLAAKIAQLSEDWRLDRHPFLRRWVAGDGPPLLPGAPGRGAVGLGAILLSTADGPPVAPHDRLLITGRDRSGLVSALSPFLFAAGTASPASTIATTPH
jgi:hypothetical protein